MLASIGIVSISCAFGESKLQEGVRGVATRAPAEMKIDGGKSVLVSGCTFDETSIGVQIESGAKRFSITNNVFPKMAHLALVDKSASDAKKIIAQNLAGEL